jgi:hypothetical protein
MSGFLPTCQDRFVGSDCRSSSRRFGLCRSQRPDPLTLRVLELGAFITRDGTAAFTHRAVYEFVSHRMSSWKAPSPKHRGSEYPQVAPRRNHGRTALEWMVGLAVPHLTLRSSRCRTRLWVPNVVLARMEAQRAPRSYQLTSSMTAGGIIVGARQPRLIPASSTQ